jgi:putative DNA primase/helicase
VNWVLAYPYEDGSVNRDAKPTKQPVAAYDTGHARPVRWHSGLSDDEHPSTEFDDVVDWDGLRIGAEIKASSRVISTELGIGIIIPVGGGEGKPVTLLDWDDVRDPETEEIHPVCAEALRKYDGFAEISQSGEGIHQFIIGEIPGGLSKFLRHIDDEPFVGDDLPMLEMYCSGRLTAMTGTHVSGCGTDVVEDQGLIDDLCWEFGTADNNSPGTPTDPFGGERDDSSDTETPSHSEVGEALREAVKYDGPHPDDWDIPDEWSLRYAAVIRAREDGGNASIANWELNGYAGALGYHMGRSLDDIIADLDAVCDDDDVRREVRQAHRKAEAGNYEPPSKATLANRGLLPDDCAEEPGWSPSFDVTDDGSAPAARSQTDGGTVADTGNDDAPELDRYGRFETDVRQAIEEMSDNEEMTQRTVRHRISKALVRHYNFVRPEQEVRGWRTKLYSYDGEVGVYEPRGDTRIERLLEKAAGDYVTNQVVSEIQGKVGRKTTERGDRFEQDPECIVVEDGILDLHTGELNPVSPAEYHRTTVPPKWDTPVEEPDAIDDFFHEIVADEDVDTLYRLVAHTLYKEYIGEKAAILIGNGQNGKSMFLNLVEEFIGQFNVTHRELQDFDANGFAANNLEGKLANLATELGEQQLNDATVFKKLTGRDTLDANVKYEKPITFENHATLMFATNEMPVFGQDNHAIWRRWVYVEFPYEFSKKGDKDPVEKNKLMRRLTQPKEMQGLLKRAQQEIQRWHETDEDFFEDSMDPDELRGKMKKAAEPVFNFATTCFRIGDSDDSYVEKSDVREAYRAYADAEDLPSFDRNTLGERLINLRDFQIESENKRIDGVRTPVYKGVELSPRGRQVTGVDEPDTGAGQSTVEFEQKEPIVMDELRTMVENNDGEPVSRNALAWRAAGGEMGKTDAEDAIDSLAEKGEVIVTSGTVMPLPSN